MIKNTKEFGDALDPCFVIIGGLQLGGMYIGIGLKMKKVKAVQLVLQGIDESNVVSYQ